jgi:hypothetical protein
VALSAPEPIGTNHQTGDFTSGIVSLDEWLKRRALANQASGAARTFVVCGAERSLAGYSCGSPNAIPRASGLKCGGLEIYT